MKKFSWACCAFLVLFSFGASSQTIWDRAKQIPVGIISGSVAGTYARFSQDMVSALSEDSGIRLVAVLGRGSQQNVADLLWLKGIDVAIVQSDVLAAFRQNNQGKKLVNKISYITKLYNEEIHIIAKAGINKLSELKNGVVAIGNSGSGTAMTSRLLFKTLGIFPNLNHLSSLDAIHQVKLGKIDAAVFVAGKPTPAFSKITSKDNVKFLEIINNETLRSFGYLDGRIEHKDYPNIIGSGQVVRTIAVGAVLAVYNWGENQPRYKSTAQFIDSLYKNLNKLKSGGGFHPKWKEVEFNNPLPGWQRFHAAEEILRNPPDQR